MGERAFRKLEEQCNEAWERAGRPCSLNIGGKVSKRLPDGRIIPGRPAKVFILRTRTCECGGPLGFTKQGEGGKSKDFLKAKRWIFRCTYCGRRYVEPRPRRVS